MRQTARTEQNGCSESVATSLRYKVRNDHLGFSFNTHDDSTPMFAL